MQPPTLLRTLVKERLYRLLNLVLSVGKNACFDIAIHYSIFHWGMLAANILTMGRAQFGVEKEIPERHIETLAP